MEKNVRRSIMRSIPACTGEPGNSMITLYHGTVYPRVYGGTDFALLDMPAVPGLSPRVRGNRHSLWHRREKSGSIPACTGEP